MICLCLRCCLGEALPFLGLVTLDKDFFMPIDRVHHSCVIPISHQAPDLLQREAQLSAQTVARLVAEVDEGHRPAGAAEGRHGHVVLLGHLRHDLTSGRLSGSRRGFDGDLNHDGNWRRTVEGVRVGRRGGLGVNETDGGLPLYAAI